MTAANPRNTLIRAWSPDLWSNYGNVVVAEVLRRRVEVMVPTMVNGKPGHYRRDFPGAVLIDSGESLGPLGIAFQRGHKYRVTIADTDEYAWVPTAANLGVADYWTIELVPFLEWHRATQPSDSDIIREAHQ